MENEINFLFKLFKGKVTRLIVVFRRSSHLWQATQHGHTYHEHCALLQLADEAWVRKTGARARLQGSREKGSVWRGERFRMHKELERLHGCFHRGYTYRLPNRQEGSATWFTWWVENLRPYLTCSKLQAGRFRKRALEKIEVRRNLTSVVHEIRRDRSRACHLQETIWKYYETTKEQLFYCYGSISIIFPKTLKYILKT